MMTSIVFDHKSFISHRKHGKHRNVAYGEVKSEKSVSHGKHRKHRKSLEIRV